MTNPYINVEDRVNYDIPKLERLYRKRAENKWVQDNLPGRVCLNTQVGEMNTFADVGAFIGRFNINMALQLAAMKISSASPANFNDFLPYLDQTIAFLSCIFSENLNGVPNKSPKGKTFDFGAIFLDIPFDFLKIYGRALLALLEKLAVEIIRKIFLEILSVIDCEKIDKCIVPCDPNDNPYKKYLVKPLIKESMSTAVFFGEKILDGKFGANGFDIKEDEMKEYAKKALSRLAPDELECLLNGFMSSDVIQFLIELFKDHTGHDIQSTDVTSIFNGINEIVDLVPYTPETIDNNDCGLISLDSVARMRLRREGLSEQEITNRMNLVIQESRGKLTTITNFLRALPAASPNLDDVAFEDENGNQYSNAPIVVAVIDKSIDLIFDSINVNSIYVSELLNQLLVYSLGEICLGYYWTNWGKNAIDNSGVVGDELLENPIKSDPIKAKIADELDPLPTIPEDLLLEENRSENFHSKYLIPTPIRFPGFFIEIATSGDILVFLNNEIAYTLIGNKLTGSDGTIQTINYEEVPVNYIISTNRNDLTSLFTKYNSVKLVNTELYSVEDESDNILNNIYTNIHSFIEDSVSKEFFFQEFTENTSINKKQFVETDFLDMEEVKIRVKERINA